MARWAGAAAGRKHVRSSRSRDPLVRCCRSLSVLCAVLGAGGGQPLVEPDGLVAVGAPRGEQRDGQIDIGGAGGAQVRETRAGELGTELRILGGRDVLSLIEVTRTPQLGARCALQLGETIEVLHAKPTKSDWRPFPKRGFFL